MEKLKFKTFKEAKDLQKWANSKDGTDWISSIHFNIMDLQWYIWYIS